jgi:ABC-type phosphate transport system substrate-binding protein
VSRRPPPRFLSSLVAVALCALGGMRATSAPAPAFRVIVNAANPTTSVERRFLADLFLKKITRWPSGEGARPIDERAESPARLGFSEVVLERSVASVKNYWAQQMFSGRAVPPPELDGDDDVVRFVLKNLGAVGYVSAGAALGGTKTLIVK